MMPDAPSSTFSNIGDNPVESTVVCVVTRFGLKSILDLLATYRDYRRVIAQARSSNPSGLLRSAFLIEDRRTCYVLSIWGSYEAIPDFGTATPLHVDAARRLFGRSRPGAKGGPELWSTKWRLTSVSNNLTWDDFDLRGWLLSRHKDGVPPSMAYRGGLGP